MLGVEDAPEPRVDVRQQVALAEVDDLRVVELGRACLLGAVGAAVVGLAVVTVPRYLGALVENAHDDDAGNATA